MRFYRHDPIAGQHGFTMVELAITLTVVSIIAAGFIMNTIQASTVKAQDVTMQRMESIRVELQKYYLSHSRVPCPAPGTSQLDTTAYGQEATGSFGSYDGNCFNNGNADLLTTSSVALGAIPIKQLNLPDEAGLDGWGRKIIYAVDQNYTKVGASGTAALTLNDIATSSTIGVFPVILISTGKNGYGGFPATGSTIAGRIAPPAPNANFLAKDNENVHLAAFTTAFDATFKRADFNPDSATGFGQIVIPVTLK